ncbi:unnamed protein product [Mycena citricolor]|uniref:Uncharacterized protein n=1 Tax=Mycena citricolor TaxID=2018698 RepID=A0AAD2GYM2_9AGAR|nr:unnamed protein product [Mycena citricolor]
MCVTLRVDGSRCVATHTTRPIHSSEPHRRYTSRTLPRRINQCEAGLLSPNSIPRGAMELAPLRTSGPSGREQSFPSAHAAFHLILHNIS